MNENEAITKEQILSLGYEQQEVLDSKCFFQKKLANGVTVHLFYSSELNSMSVDCEYPDREGKDVQLNRMEVRNFDEMKTILSRLGRVREQARLGKLVEKLSERPEGFKTAELLPWGPVMEALKSVVNHRNNRDGAGFADDIAAQYDWKHKMEHLGMMLREASGFMEGMMKRFQEMIDERCNETGSIGKLEFRSRDGHIVEPLENHSGYFQINAILEVGFCIDPKDLPT